MKDHWHPASEPPKGRTCTVLGFYRLVHSFEIDQGFMVIEWQDNRWIDFTTGRPVTDITHWCHLPPRPKFLNNQ